MSCDVTFLSYNVVHNWSIQDQGLHFLTIQTAPYIIPLLALISLPPLGLVMVDCRNVKKLLIAKQKRIAAELFEVLEKKTKEYADSVMDEFK